MNCYWPQLLIETVEEPPPLKIAHFTCSAQYKPNLDNTYKRELYCCSASRQHFDSVRNYIEMYLLFKYLIFCTHSLGFASTGGGSLLTNAPVRSSSDGLDVSLCSFSSSSGSLKCTRRPTLELEREALWVFWAPVFRQELGGGSGRGTTMGLPFWWFGVPLTLGLVSGEVPEGLDTTCSVSTADGAVKGFGYERSWSACLLLCGPRHAPLDSGGPWWRNEGSKFGVLMVREFRQELFLFRLVGSRLGRLVRKRSGRSMLELLGSRRSVLVFKGSSRKVLEISGSRRMVLEWGLILLITGTSGWRFTVGTDGEGSWTCPDSTVKLLKGLKWLLFLPLPKGELERWMYRNVKVLL